MEMTTLIIVGVIVLIAIITIIGILSRYRKCKSDELLVVYGKTGSHKEKVNELDAKGNQVSREVEIKTARVYHGGAAFVWPIIQGYEVMSMRPIQLNLTLKDALSAQNIRVTVYGNENTAGSFMAKTAENLNPAFELLKSIPFKKTFKEMFVEDNPTEDNFEAVK